MLTSDDEYVLRPQVVPFCLYRRCSTGDAAARPQKTIVRRVEERILGLVFNVSGTARERLETKEFAK